MGTEYSDLQAAEEKHAKDTEFLLPAHLETFDVWCRKREYYEVHAQMRQHCTKEKFSIINLAIRWYRPVPEALDWDTVKYYRCNLSSRSASDSLPKN